MTPVRESLSDGYSYRIGYTVVLDIHAEQEILDDLCYVVDIPPAIAHRLLARMDRIKEWKQQDESLGSANFYEIDGTWAHVNTDNDDDLVPGDLNDPENIARVDGEHIKVYDDVLYFVCYYGDVTIESDPVYRKDLEKLLALPDQIDPDTGLCNHGLESGLCKAGCTA